MSADRISSPLLINRNLDDIEAVGQELADWESVGAWQLMYKLQELSKIFKTIRPIGTFDLREFSSAMKNREMLEQKDVILSILGERNPRFDTTLLFRFGRGIHSQLLITNNETLKGIRIDNLPANPSNPFLRLTDVYEKDVAPPWTPFKKYITASRLIFSLQYNFHENLSAQT